ncbi:MAG: hypothetical protein WDW38_009842 [Sanguina aurantia]
MHNTAASVSAAQPVVSHTEPHRSSSPTLTPFSSSSSSSSSSASDDISSSLDMDFGAFCAHAQAGSNLIPLMTRIFSDHLTPVLAYRCLVRENDVAAPSFLLESVVNGNQQGRYSFLGAMPALEVVATGSSVVVMDHEKGTRCSSVESDPMEVPERLSRKWRAAKVDGLPQVFTGGWVGYAGYDTVRYVYGRHASSSDPPVGRGLHPWTTGSNLPEAPPAASSQCQDASSQSRLQEAYLSGAGRLSHLIEQLSTQPPAMAAGQIAMSLAQKPSVPGVSNLTEAEFLEGVMAAKEHIQAGDIFQLVLSQRFERRTFADPFEIYRALRVVNPSPYMVYMQARGSILVSSSPEILARVDSDRIVTNRPLAGTRPRGRTPQADLDLEKELLADPKECSEHVMLVDLGRNDVGKVAMSGTVVVEKLMEVERYSHVMHISSTVTGKLLPELDVWDALRAALPAGTVSGAPKVSAMKIIDRLEHLRRGPYGGGIGHVSFTGTMDMALGLRTMVIPTESRDTLYQYQTKQSPGRGHAGSGWCTCRPEQALLQTATLQQNTKRPSTRQQHSGGQSTLQKRHFSLKMGGGNAQKSAMSRAKNQEKAKAAGGGGENDSL